MNFIEKIGLTFFLLGCFLMLNLILEKSPYSFLANILILPGMLFFLFGDEIEKKHDKEN